MLNGSPGAHITLGIYSPVGGTGRFQSPAHGTGPVTIDAHADGFVSLHIGGCYKASCMYGASLLLGYFNEQQGRRGFPMGRYTTLSD